MDRRDPYRDRYEQRRPQYSPHNERGPPRDYDRRRDYREPPMDRRDSGPPRGGRYDSPRGGRGGSFGGRGGISQRVVNQVTPIELAVNHFPMKIVRNRIYQYQVEFEPEIERKGAKFRMLHENADTLGENIVFDGRMLFISKEAPEEMKLHGTYNGINYNILIIATKILNESDSDIPLQFYDLLFKKVDNTLILLLLLNLILIYFILDSSFYEIKTNGKTIF